MTDQDLTDLRSKVAQLEAQNAALAVVITSLIGMLPEEQKNVALHTVDNVLLRAEVVFMSIQTEDADAALTGIKKLRGGLLGQQRSHPGSAKRAASSLDRDQSDVEDTPSPS